MMIIIEAYKSKQLKLGTFRATPWLHYWSKTFGAQ